MKQRTYCLLFYSDLPRRNLETNRQPLNEEPTDQDIEEEEEDVEDDVLWEQLKVAKGMANACALSGFPSSPDPPQASESRRRSR